MPAFDVASTSLLADTITHMSTTASPTGLFSSSVAPTSGILSSVVVITLAAGGAVALALILCVAIGAYLVYRPRKIETPSRPVSPTIAGVFLSDPHHKSWEGGWQIRRPRSLCTYASRTSEAYTAYIVQPEIQDWTMYERHICSAQTSQSRSEATIKEVGEPRRILGPSVRSETGLNFSENHLGGDSLRGVFSHGQDSRTAASNSADINTRTPHVTLSESSVHAVSVDA